MLEQCYVFILAKETTKGSKIRRTGLVNRASSQIADHHRFHRGAPRFEGGADFRLKLTVSDDTGRVGMGYQFGKVLAITVGKQLFGEERHNGRDGSQKDGAGVRRI